MMRGTALVAGASGSIGSAVCSKLLQSHFDVVGLYRRSDAHVALAAEAAPKAQSRYHPLRCDLSSDSGVARAYAQVRQLASAPEVLIFAAGATARQSLLLGKAESVRALF